jgi:hypothetical protein
MTSVKTFVMQFSSMALSDEDTGLSKFILSVQEGLDRRNALHIKSKVL